MRAFVRAIGLCGPGLATWPQAAAVLAGHVAYAGAYAGAYAAAGPACPQPHLLPAALARRASPTTRLALAVAGEALAGMTRPPAGLRSVLACAGGDAEALDGMLSALADHGQMSSPAQFALSGHGAVAGMLAIALGARGAATAIAAYDGSFAAGLLEAVTMLAEHGGAVLLIAYDRPPPAPLKAQRAVSAALAASLLLSGDERAPHHGILDATLVGAEPEDRLIDAGLERLRSTNPAARCLPLLEAVACGRRRSIVLPYLTDRRVLVIYDRC